MATTTLDLILADFRGYLLHSTTLHFKYSYLTIDHKKVEILIYKKKWIATD